MRIAHTVGSFALSLGLATVLALALSAHARADGEEVGKPILSQDWIGALNWRSIGPANMGGRIIALAVNEADASTFWVASASGGLLKTVNNGISYEHQFDHENTVSIGHVAVAPSDPNIVWVGTGEANPRNSVSYGDGVYKSTDGGKTWMHMGLRDSFQIGRIAIHPENPDIVYVGALGRLYGPNEERGLYKTTNGGESWERVLFIDDKTGVVDVDMHPTDPDTLIVATYERARDGFDTNDPSKKHGPGSGIYKTTDGGKTWSKMTVGLPTVNLGRIGLDYYRKDPNVVFVVVESERITKLAPDSAFMGMSGEDAEVGARLTNITEDGPAAKAGLAVGDIVLRINEEPVGGYEALVKIIRNHTEDDTVSVEYVRDRQFQTTEVTFAKNPNPNQAPFSGGLGGQRENMQDMQGPDGFETGGVFRSEDGGESWSRVNSLNPRPMYYSQIRVDPSDDKYLYVLGTSLYRSEDGGKTFRGDGGRGGVHVDHHALWIDPNDGRHMMLGNDGGLYTTYDRMQNWDHENKNALGQFYHVGIDATPFYRVYGGLQDNGSWGGPSRTRSGRGVVNSDWIRVSGGDGFVCLVDPNDPDQIYFESQGGAMGRLHYSTGERGFIRPRPPRGTRYRFNWKTPFILSNHNSKIFYAAGNYVFRSLNRGDNMKRISLQITATDRGSATALSESPLDPDVLYVGTDDGALSVTRDGGQTWTELFANEQIQPKEDEADEQQPQAADRTDRRAAMLRQMVERLDENSDGLLQKSEVPERMHQLFDDMDDNSDGVIDKDEMARLQPAAEPEPIPGDPVSGAWKAILKGEGIPPESSGFTLELTLKDDGSIEGTLRAQTMQGTVSEGSFDKSTGRVEITFTQDDRSIQLSGTVKDNIMTGTIEVAGGLLNITFEAKRGGGESPSKVAPTEEPEPAPEQLTPAPADPVTGVWEGALSGDQLPDDLTFTLTLKLEKDGSITGHASSDQGVIEITTGSFEAKVGRLTLRLASDDVDVTIVGTIKGEQMTGTLDVAGMMSAEFKAKKIKPVAPRTEFMPPHPGGRGTLGAILGGALVAHQGALMTSDIRLRATGESVNRFDDPVSGEWTMHFVSEQFTAEFTLVLKLREKKVTGSFTSQFSDAEIEGGTFDPETGRLTLPFTTQRGDSSIEATVADDRMSGTMTGGGGQFSVDVEGTRTKAPQQEAPQPEAIREPEEEQGEQPAKSDRLADVIPKRMWVSSIEASRYEAGRVYVTLDAHRSDNDDPWILVSEDFGDTWKLLSAELPRGSSRVLREDIENPDVLYLGTEFAAWVSVDRGGSWTKLNGKLPTVAIHEFAQHPTMGEMVAATHGRSLWILDVTPIRQMTPATLTASAHLYKPNRSVIWRTQPSRGRNGLHEFVGENPPSGAQIYYSLGQQADSVSLSIEDLSGNTIRELDASEEEGLHRITWDLRETPRQQGQRRGAGFGRGGGQGFGRGRGRVASPGSYNVVFVVNGERYTQILDIVADPDYPNSPFAVEEQERFDAVWNESVHDDRRDRDRTSADDSD